MEYRCEMPVLLLFFNRPQHAETVLDRVRLVQPARLYVHCDGPRAGVDGEAAQVAAVRGLLDKIDWPCAVKTLFRDQNMGLRAGVYDALNWFFDQEEMGIVLEDDCLPDVSFFPFCEAMLQQYQHEAKVMHIAGFNMAAASTEHNIESYFFSKFIYVWGWASWRRAWKKMSIDLEGLDVFVAQKRMNELTEGFLPQQYMLDKFQKTQQKRNNSWAYAWFFSILNAGGLSIVPVKNLVQNTGIGDMGATHTNHKNDKASIRSTPLDFPLIHPREIQPVPRLDKQLFYLSQKSRGRLILWYILKKAGLR